MVAEHNAATRVSPQPVKLEERTTPPSLDIATLPPAVARLRARILRAAASRNIDDLLIPIQWNEVPPLFKRGQAQGFDPIAYLKAQSFDGQGLEMLRIIDAVFRQPFAVRTQGPTTVFTWPCFAVVPEREPRPRDRLAPWTCTRFADFVPHSANVSPVVFETAIGPDGTWHYFWQAP